MEHLDLLRDILASLKNIERLLVEQTGRAALGNLKPDLPLLEHGRRPAFWRDEEVRDFFTVAHRRMSLSEAREECRQRFGVDRVPSRSAVHRYWGKLDAVTRRAA